MHTLNCYLVADGEGRVVVVGGTPGGDRQPQWNLQAVVGLIDGRWDVQQVVERPQWVTTTPPASSNGFELRLEGRFGPAFAEALRDRGHQVVVEGEWSGLSALQIIARDPSSGVLVGGSDPRAEGLALGL